MLVTDEGSEAHYHWHGLIHFPSRKSEVGSDKLDESILSFRRQRTCLRKSSALIMTLVCCVTWHAEATSELVVEMEMVSMHTTHGSRLMRVTVCSHKCPKNRDEISEKVADFLDLSWKTNWTVHELHNSKACLCSRGKNGTEERADVIEKRRTYYKTGAGLEMKKTYREKANMIRQIINQLTMLDASKKACYDHK